MKTFGERFQELTDEAMKFIKEKVKETPELILFDIDDTDDDGCIREEVYELPSQLLYRKYDIMTYKIWSLTLEGEVIYAHGIDTDEYGNAHVFTLDMTEMGYGTIIDIATYLS
jgi:hypothetical protein